jgi:endogenous inhibitor of DNA gyrase (YacG/DUF329 family)
MSDTPANDNAAAGRQPACPLCGRPRSTQHKPFCSRRCADVDLYHWLSGAYVIQGSDESDEETQLDAPGAPRNDFGAKI